MLYNIEKNLKRAVVLIPARFSSSRFPGKPLAKILGKEMILYVAELSTKAVGINNVYIITDDNRIKKVVESSGYQVIMSKNIAITGTDRIAEAANLIKADIFINVQGDEPLLNPEDIVRVINCKLKNYDKVVNCYNFLSNNENPESINIPKVITNENNELVYISREKIPGAKDFTNINIQYKKQVCIYAFNLNELNSFLLYGKKSELEKIEDIEILRFFELNIKILMLETNIHSIAVDTPEDLINVENILKNEFRNI